jgi:predicted nuclease of predicted toxin-antitoxin system
MKILLDECIDRKLAKDFAGYEVKTVPQWDGRA